MPQAEKTCPITGLPFVAPFPGLSEFSGERTLAMRIVDKWSSKGRTQKRMLMIRSDCLVLAELSSPPAVKRFLRIQDIDEVIYQPDVKPPAPKKAPGWKLLIKNRDFDTLVQQTPEPRNPAGLTDAGVVDVLRVLSEKLGAGIRFEEAGPEANLLSRAKLDKARSQGYDSPHKLARQASLRRMDDEARQRQGTTCSDRSDSGTPRGSFASLFGGRRRSQQPGSVFPAAGENTLPQQRSLSPPGASSDAGSEEPQSPALGAFGNFDLPGGIGAPRQMLESRGERRTLKLEKRGEEAIGIECEEGTMCIAALIPGGPAEKAGARVGWHVTAVGGDSVDKPGEMHAAYDTSPDGQVAVEFAVIDAPALPPIVRPPASLMAFQHNSLRFIRVVEKKTSKGSRQKRVVVLTSGFFMLVDLGGTIRRFVRLTDIREIVTQWVTEKAAFGPSQRVVQVLLKMADGCDALFVQTRDERNAPDQDQEEFPRVLLRVVAHHAPAFARLERAPPKWTWAEEGTDLTAQAALKKPSDYLTPQQMVERHRSQSAISSGGDPSSTNASDQRRASWFQMPTFRSGTSTEQKQHKGSAERGRPETPQGAGQVGAAPASSAAPAEEEDTPPPSPRRLSFAELSPSELAAVLDACPPLDQGRLHADMRKALSGFSSKVLWARVMDRVRPSGHRAKRVLVITPQHVATADLSGAVRRFVLLEEIAEAVPEPQPTMVRLRLSRGPDIAAETVYPEPRNAGTPGETFDEVLRTVLKARNVSPDKGLLLQSLSSLEWTQTHADISVDMGPGKHSLTTPVPAAPRQAEQQPRALERPKSCAVTGIPLAPCPGELANFADAEPLFIRIVQKIGHRGNKATRIILLTHNRLVFCEPGGEVKRFVRLDSVTDMILQEAPATAFSWTQLAAAGGQIKRVLLKMPSEGLDLMFEQVPDDRNTANDQDALPGFLRDLARRRGQLLRERTARAGEDLHESSACLDKPREYRRPMQNLKAVALLSSPEEQRIVQQADSLRKALAEGAASGDGVKAVLWEVRSDAHWAALLQTFAEQHPTCHKGDLRKALSDELPRTDLEEVKAVLRKNGVDHAIPSNRGLSLAPLEATLGTLVRRASQSPERDRSRSTLEEDLPPPASPPVSPSAMAFKPLWLQADIAEVQSRRSSLPPSSEELVPISPPPGLALFRDSNMLFVRVVEKQAAKRHKQKRVLCLTTSHLLLCEERGAIKRYLPVSSIEEMVVQEVPAARRGIFGAGKDTGRMLRILLRAPGDLPDLLVTQVYDARNEEPDDQDKFPRLLRSLMESRSLPLAERRAAPDARLEAEAVLEKPPGYVKPRDRIRERQASQGSLRQQASRAESMPPAAASEGEADSAPPSPRAVDNRGSLEEQISVAQQLGAEQDRLGSTAERLRQCALARDTAALCSMLEGISDVRHWREMNRLHAQKWGGTELRTVMADSLQPVELSAAKLALSPVPWGKRSALRDMASQVKRLLTVASDTFHPDNFLRKMMAYSFVTGTSEEVSGDMQRFAQRLMEWYDRKPGTLMDELSANLRVPPDLGAADAVACIAAGLASQERLRKDYPNASPLELLVLRQYTQRPIDIDRDLGWADVPPPAADAEDPQLERSRADYEARYTSWDWAEERDGERCRNGSVFGPVCSAMRDQGPGGQRRDWSEKVLQRWIKWICTVSACCATRCGAPEPPAGDMLYRGLGGGGVSEEVVAKHRALTPGGLLCWPALSSCSSDRAQSREYMLGTAANSTAAPNAQNPGTIFVRIRGAAPHGLPLQQLSQYSREAELLLAPLVHFTVDSVERDPGNPFGQGVLLDVTCAGPLGRALHRSPELHSFFERVRADARRAGEALARAAECDSPRATLPQLEAVDAARRSSQLESVAAAAEAVMLRSTGSAPTERAVGAERRGQPAPPNGVGAASAAEAAELRRQLADARAQLADASAQLQRLGAAPAAAPQMDPALRGLLGEAGLSEAECAALCGVGVRRSSDFGLVTAAELARVLPPVAARRALQAAGWQPGSTEAACCVPRAAAAAAGAQPAPGSPESAASPERALRIAQERLRIMGLENKSLKETISCLKEQIQLMRERQAGGYSASPPAPRR
eukprot:TRINITY_DN10268_c0_g1_i1.p1 TRINITY_DN10268_c0_g1~~TRINITY_DN10268_c0_g1_i1.p1  ORF type:complete len:2135 (+),score=759.37 TRINITY_DN10268_c0_g1_i1:106-6405(+)